MNNTDEHTIRTDFIEKIGLITQAEGLPRIAGRVFGMLVFDGDPISFGTIADRLEVSRASVSTSIKLLEERAMIKRIAKPGDRQDYFKLANKPYENMMSLVRARARSTKDDIQETVDLLPEDAEPVGRLLDFLEFYEKLDFALGIALEASPSTGQKSSGGLTDE